MPSLTIRHVTTYRYRHPVAFGEHRMMLRPRESCGQKVTDARLGITPAPTSLRYVQDAFGNHVAIAEFDARSTELSFESVVSVERATSAAMACGTGDPRDLSSCRQPLHADPQGDVARWVRQFLPADDSNDALAFLTNVAKGIHAGFVYRRREAKGVQTPLETLRLGRGTCRDFALLMVEAARSLGFAALFASGYLAAPFAGSSEPDDGTAVSSPHGATHAWAQIHLPDRGWIDFDPTAGTVGTASLVTVAVVCDPYDALPLYGTYVGAAADFLGMDVSVSVTPGDA